jgi:hypothetical protein
MNKNFEHELENPESWDYEHVETIEPVKSPRVVVSVAFRRHDFETVSDYAEHLGKKTSEFIREAALDKATGRTSKTPIYTSGNKGSLWSISDLPSNTRVSTSEIEWRTNEPVVTSS